MTYEIGHIQKVDEENYHLHVDSDTNLKRYRYKRERHIRTYGATTVHYSYKKAS